MHAPHPDDNVIRLFCLQCAWSVAHRGTVYPETVPFLAARRAEHCREQHAEMAQNVTTVRSL